MPIYIPIFYPGAADGKDQNHAALESALDEAQEELYRARERIELSSRNAVLLGDLLDASRCRYKRCQEDLWDC